MIIMTIVFSTMFSRNIENFPVYLFTGKMLFDFMSTSTNQAMTSVTGNAALLKKTYVPKYIFYALSSEIGNHQLWSIANKKATRPEVGLDEVKYIKLCIPLSVTEQKQIADFLDEKLNQINNAISNHANLIRKLEEYKKSLIYYAVTGKIDCRNEEI